MQWREPIKILADLFTSELGLTEDRIFIYNDGRPLPKDKGVYLVLTINGETPFRNSTRVIKEPFTEIREMNLRQNIIVSVISKDNTARLVSYDLIGCLSSIKSQQLQSEYGISIPRQVNVTDASFLENTAMLTRFDVAIPVLYWRKVEKQADYFEVKDFETTFEA